MPHWKTKEPVAYRRIAPGLHMWSTRDKASRRGKTYYCYLAETERGNVIIHAPDNPAFYRDHGDTIDKLGGVKLFFLTHFGDADRAWTAAAQRFGARIYGHAQDQRLLGLSGGFSEAHAFDKHHEIVPLPGHTRGYSAMIRRDGKHAYLFGGHWLVKSLLGWRASGGLRDAEAALESLKRIETLDVDRLLPEYAWSDAGPEGEAPVTFGPKVRKRAVRDALANLGPRIKRASR